MGPSEYTDYSDYIRLYNYTINTKVPGTPRRCAISMPGASQPTVTDRSEHAAVFFEACCTLFLNPKLSLLLLRLSSVVRFARKTKTQALAGVLNPTFYVLVVNFYHFCFSSQCPYSPPSVGIGVYVYYLLSSSHTNPYSVYVCAGNLGLNYTLTRWLRMMRQQL